MNLSDFIEKILVWSRKFSHFTLLTGNQHPDIYGKYDLLFAAGARRIISADENTFDLLAQAHQNAWLFGYIGYDAKNDVERLYSKNPDSVNAPTLFFFEPEIVAFVTNGRFKIYNSTFSEDKLLKEILTTTINENKILPKIDFAARMSQSKYLEKVMALQKHIQLGDVYEVNFCQEFYAENVILQPDNVFYALNQKTRPPFAAYLNCPEISVMSASPERYLQKKGNQLISQPIKGTARRSPNKTEDEHLKAVLHASVKERAENVMIVDLVRNDLSRISVTGSVSVPELFGVYTFLTVHQLISTVTGELDNRHMWIDVLKSSFPMGSMTGAPKIRAMELIEQFETHKRGIYSGALGYIDPKGDFDFNVVIRSLIYNKRTQYLSLGVGGAITILADAEKEYNECLLKADAIFKLFQ